MVAELDEQTAAAVGVAVAKVSAKVVEVFAEPSLVFVACWLLPSIAYIMWPTISSGMLCRQQVRTTIICSPTTARRPDRWVQDSGGG